MQEFSNKYSLADRQARARAAIDVIAPRTTSNGEFQDVGYWGSAATVYSAMANYDHFVRATAYRSAVTGGLNRVFGEYAHFDQVRGFCLFSCWWIAGFAMGWVMGDADGLCAAVVWV